VGRTFAKRVEWEVAAADLPHEGNFVDQESFIPCRWMIQLASRRSRKCLAMFGNGQRFLFAVPRLVPANGALGEYNGKFMCNQWRPARRLMRHLAVTHPQNLPYLFSAERSLAVHGIRWPKGRRNSVRGGRVKIFKR
jgi:hypothetical protein